MFIYFKRQKQNNLLFLASMRCLVFMLSFFIAFGSSVASAQSLNLLNLPAPGVMVAPSPAFVPVLLKGMTIHPDDPLKFNFIVDSGYTDLEADEFKQETERLVKYFLASMTVPKDDLWVNLSPYENDRIIPEELSKTELGRDLLAQDYILKQLTASLMYPEEELGKEFWDRIYQRAEEEYGTTEIPVDTFNKVWILPEEATVYEHENTVYVVDARLKVMLDSDYLAMNYEKEEGRWKIEEDSASNQQRATSNLNISKQIIRDIILPEIEYEVNHGKNFAPLRQIYHSLILAKWYKETIKNSLLTQVYADQNKVAGIESGDEEIKDEIYAQYMEAYKKGVFNYIKEDYDRLSNEVIPRKYFSGGMKIAAGSIRALQTSSPIYGNGFEGQGANVEVTVAPERKKFSSPIINKEEVFSKVKVVTTDVGGTLDDGSVGSIEKSIKALNALVEADIPIIVVSLGSFKNVDSKFIQNIPASKRKNIQVFWAGGVAKMNYNEQGEPFDATESLGEPYIEKNFLSPAEHQQILSEIERLNSKFDLKINYQNVIEGIGAISLSVGFVSEAEREAFKQALTNGVLPPGLVDKIDLKDEGNTAILISRKGIGKSSAFRAILNQYKPSEVIYFADQFFPGGADESIVEMGVWPVAVDKDQSKAHQNTLEAGAGVDATVLWMNELAQYIRKQNQPKYGSPIEDLKTKRVMAGLHTTTGGGAYKKAYDDGRGSEFMADLAVILADNDIVPVIDQLEVLEGAVSQRSDKHWGYFIGNQWDPVEDAVKAGADVLVAIETLSAEQISRIKNTYPKVALITVIKSDASDIEAQIQTALDSGVDGIQFAPFKDFTNEGFDEAGKIIKGLRASHPDLIISGAGGVFEDRVSGVLSMSENITLAIGVNKQDRESFRAQVAKYKKAIDPVVRASSSIKKLENRFFEIVGPGGAHSFPKFIDYGEYARLQSIIEELGNKKGVEADQAAEVLEKFWKRVSNGSITGPFGSSSESNHLILEFIREAGSNLRKRKSFLQILSKEINPTMINGLNKIAYYLAVRDELPERADLLMVLGSPDPQVPAAAARLYKMGLAKKILVSGGALPHLIDQVPMEKREANKIKVALIREGVPAEDILTEPNSTSTIENIEFSKSLMEDEGLEPETVILMQFPVGQRMANEAFKKVFGKYPISYAPYIPDAVDMNDEELLLHVQQVLMFLGRFEVHGPNGSGIIDQVDIPRNVLESREAVRGLYFYLKVKNLIEKEGKDEKSAIAEAMILMKYAEQSEWNTQVITPEKINEAGAILARENDFDIKVGQDSLTLIEKGKSSSPMSNEKDIGGIDMNEINVGRAGSGVDIQFDPVGMDAVLNQNITGFKPVIINITPLPSVLPLLGLEPRREEEEYELTSI